MRVNFQAFCLSCTASGLSADDFFMKLSSVDESFTYGSRKIYIIKIEDFYAGLVLTIKDMKKFCKIIEEDKDIKVIEHRLNDNESLTEFNFFIYNSKQKSGMYQYYHHSCSLNVFLGAILYKKYSQMLIDLWSLIKPKLELDGRTEREIRNELKQYRGRLSYSIIEKQGSFEERIRKMKELSSIEFETIDAPENQFSGIGDIADYIKKQKNTLSFKPDARKKRSLIEAIANFIHQKRPIRAVVRGEDENGDDTMYKLLNDFDSFASYDYNDVVPSLMLDSENVYNSISQNEIVAKLISEYQQRSDYFTRIC